MDGFPIFSDRVLQGTQLEGAPRLGVLRIQFGFRKMVPLPGGTRPAFPRTDAETRVEMDVLETKESKLAS